MDVSRTLSEIRATATKAARGAGYDWGMAEEAGLAARVLESHDLPGVRVLAHLLAGSNGGERTRENGATCGLWAMAALSDRLPFPDDAIPTGTVAGPLMLAAPLILFARQHAVGFTLRWNGATLRCGPDGVDAKGAVDANAARGLVLEPSPGEIAATRKPDWRSRIVDATDWDVLDSFAARTLVPETAASRAMGAGPAHTSPD